MHKITVHGHRGARGYLPENTIESFLLAIDMGATAIEMDVVISADNRVVVPHEPWMHHAICTKPEGTFVGLEEEKSLNLFKMNYNQIAEFDCGKRGNVKFPQQKPLHAQKPLLDDVIIAVENYTRLNRLNPIIYNIETKCSKITEGIFHPAFDIFTQLVYDCCAKQNVIDRCIFQSFDERNLIYLKNIDQRIQLSLLSEYEINLELAIESMGFTPHYFSCLHTLLNEDLVALIKKLGMEILCWTVNSTEDIRRMKHLGVDGIISDYPDCVINILAED
nr:glycerophosphodiester phosphodiesterase [Bacteroidota bacterium]